jgi:hypothetical protein|tara:strand:- start:2426 stop:2569 length:144 start_codon:yes stop_codon:yes gene_type:complete
MSDGMNGMMDGSMMGFMMLGGGLFSLLILAVLVLGIFALVKFLRGRQ